MRFIFIVSTYGDKKRAEFLRLSKSIVKQSVFSKEILVIHIIQGSSQKYFELYASHFFASKISYLAISDLGVGLSRARNIALDTIYKNKYYSSPCYLFFSDDDCFYPDNFLKIFKRIRSSKDDLDIGIAGLVMDETRSYALPYSNEIGNHTLQISRITKNISSINFGISYNEIRFDENFGINSIFNSSEEFDYVYQRIKNGTKFHYDSDLIVYHPDPKKIKTTVFTFKFFQNSIGVGAFFAKNFHLYSLYYVFLQPIFSFIKRLLLLDMKGVIISLFSIYARPYGFIKFLIFRLKKIC